MRISSDLSAARIQAWAALAVAELAARGVRGEAGDVLSAAALTFSFWCAAAVSSPEAAEEVSVEVDAVVTVFGFPAGVKKTGCPTLQAPLSYERWLTLTSERRPPLELEAKRAGDGIGDVAATDDSSLRDEGVDVVALSRADMVYVKEVEGAER